MRAHQPDVVVTYDEKGFYGHPDHIQTHRVTMAALAAVTSPSKVYWTTAPRSVFAAMAETMRELGADWDDDPADEIGLPDDQVTTLVDVRGYAEQKFRALAAHASQAESTPFLRMDQGKFTDLMGVEAFLRVRDRTGTPVPEVDLFQGLR
jgi:LmbE family N-acetylglucosaminyl deacetylase